MGKDDKTEERKAYNAPFLRVFDYLAKEKMMNQGQFAKIIKSESGYISLLRSGVKKVGPEYIARISIEFAKHFDGEYHLNPDYIDGTSEYMIIENVPDDETLNKINHAANPDYKLMNQRKKHDTQQPMMSTYELSLLIEKAVEKATAYAEKAIATLESKLKDKDDYIKLLENRVSDLESKQKFSDGEEIIRKHPFEIGVADDGNNNNKKQART